MKAFEYRAATATGEIVHGTAWSGSEMELDAQLESRGLLLTRAKAIADARRGRRLKVKHDDLIILTNQLATVTSAGVPLVEGLRGIGQRLQSANGREVAYAAILRRRMAGGPAFDGRWRRCALGNAEATYSVQDVSGLLDVNTAHPSLQNAVLGARFGQEGKRVADAILARRKDAIEANEIAFPSLRDVTRLFALPEGAAPKYLAELTASSGALGIAPIAAQEETRSAVLSLNLPRYLAMRPAGQRFRIKSLGRSGAASRLDVIVVRFAPGSDPPFEVEQNPLRSGWLVHLVLRELPPGP